MKFTFLWLLVLGVIVTGMYFFLRVQQEPPTSEEIAVSVSPTEETAGCGKEDIQATISLEGGAGNVFGVATVKNISSGSCPLNGDSYVTLAYDKEKFANINEATIGPAEQETFDLAPEDAIYSHLRYPNGPQCGGGTVQVPISFMYELPTGESIPLVDSTGQDSFSLQACEGSGEITELNIYPFSTDKEF